MSVLFLFLIILAGAESAFAQETRCQALGANCVCSEPLNTSVLSPIGGTGYINPGDSVVKPCNVSFDGQPSGAAIFYNQPPFGIPGTSGIQSSSDGLVLSRMPQRTNVQFFVRSPEGQIGEFSLGNMQLSPQGGVAPYTRTQVAALIPGTVNGQYIATVKWAQRFYKYYSDNFEMGGDG